jgi:hypothetical protein
VTDLSNQLNDGVVDDKSMEAQTGNDFYFYFTEGEFELPSEADD